MNSECTQDDEDNDGSYTPDPEIRVLSLAPQLRKHIPESGTPRQARTTGAQGPFEHGLVPSLLARRSAGGVWVT
jgi:hypothetical protein